jgi:hypothetical protein
MRRSVRRHDFDALQHTVNARAQSFNTSDMFNVGAHRAVRKKCCKGTAYSLYTDLAAAAGVDANDVFFIRPAGHELIDVTELQCIVKSGFCVIGMQFMCCRLLPGLDGELELQASDGRRCVVQISATTLAVMTLRTVTAVTTSSPWLKAVRAATWLAPIMKAISSKVPKAAPLKRAGVVKAMPSCCGV